MASLFPDLPEIYQGYYGTRMADEGLQQAVSNSKLRDLEAQRQAVQLSEMQAGLPLAAQKRELEMGQTQGAMQRLPFENTRALSTAEAAASPERLAAENAAALQAAQNKAAHERDVAQVREQELFMQAFHPMLESMAAGDFEGTNAGWDSAFELLEKHKVPGVEQLKIVPREQLYKKIYEQYTQAANTVPVIKQRIAAREQHERAMEIERLKAKSRENVARVRTDASDPTSDRVFGALLQQYGKDPSKLTDEQRGILRNRLERDLSKYEPETDDRLWREAGAYLRSTDPDNKKTAAERTEILREAYSRAKDGYLKRNYRHLYPGVAKSDASRTAPAELQSALRKSGIPYEPDKFDYAIRSDGAVVSRPKQGR